MNIQPKPYLEKLKLRNKAIGTERRRNMSKMILENGTPLPKPIEYSDIDQAMYDWLDSKFDLVYDGKRLPTYKLYSVQRVNEYMQSWDKLDDTGNLIINFKTISRETNPQKGENQGTWYNIPGHKDFAMFYVPILQENGTEAYDKYTMKQPTSVNFAYTISIITNKMELVNEMNEKMHYEFNSITTYISPNDHPMSMTLEDVSDESEYTIDDRKYYSQTYKIKVRGYIIRKEDFKVERIPSRFMLSWKDSDASGIVNRRGKNRRSEDKVAFIDEIPRDSEKYQDWLKEEATCEPIGLPTATTRSSDVDESNDCGNPCDIEPSYRFKAVNILVKFGCVSTDDAVANNTVEFVIDKEVVLTSMKGRNAAACNVAVNGEKMDFPINLASGDTVTLNVIRKDEFNDSIVTLVGYDPNVAISNDEIAETSLDEPYDEEDIYVNYDDGEE